MRKEVIVKELISVSEACKILGIHRSTMWRKKFILVSSGVKFVKVFGETEKTLRIERDSLIDYIQRRIDANGK